MKRTDLSMSQPQSQEQPPRAKKYRQREFDGISNSGMSGAGMSQVGSAIGGQSMGGSDAAFMQPAGNGPFMKSTGNDLGQKSKPQAQKKQTASGTPAMAVESPNHQVSTGGANSQSSNLNRKNSRKMLQQKMKQSSEQAIQSKQGNLGSVKNPPQIGSNQK